MKHGVKVKQNLFLLAIPGICDLAGCCFYYEMLESTLSAYFFLLLPTSLIKGLLKTVKTKRGSISGIGVESPGFLSHVSMTDGKCFRGKSTQVAAKNSMCKCTWQVQEKKKHLCLLLETCLIPYLSEYMTCLFILTMSRGKLRSGNSISRGYT